MALEETGTVHADVQVFSDGSGLEGGIRAAAVLFKNSQEKRVLRKYLGNENSHTVFKAEVLGMSLAAELIRTEQSV